MDEIQSIQWFPGHMTKTKRKIQENLKLVDAVAEVIDARIPISSRNPDLDKIIQGKPRIIIMNKCDMADSNITAQWISYFKNQGIASIAVDCKTGRGLNNFIPTIRSVLSDKIEKWESKGMKNRTIKVMIVGVPNVGKSSFINRIAKNNKAKVEDRPGVTRGNQWFTVGKGFEILDTPGVLWPKFDDKIVGEKLAFTGAVKDQIIDTERLCSRLLLFLRENYPNELTKRYKLTNDEISDISGYDMLLLIGKKRGMLMSGGNIDTQRASIIILDEFRGAVIGKMTLERVKS